MMKRIAKTSGLLCFCIIQSVNALPTIALPTEPIYFEPEAITPSEQMTQYSCVQLDNSIRQLQPYRYTYKPNFYHDKTNMTATSLVAFDAIPLVGGLVGLGYLGYSSLIEEKESRRMLSIEQQIAMLQQLKAEQHCFE